ncbi:hypothetical protein AX14_003857 [Amanita brunnescens Koide BX004]|nr:hypothetical protein AX14_003857 [Amanita brunnescens Koide BX004]
MVYGHLNVINTLIAVSWNGDKERRAVSTASELSNSRALVSTANRIPPLPQVQSLGQWPLSYIQIAHDIVASPDSIQPMYVVHAAEPIPADGFVAPYTSTITPSAAYLSDPLNSSSPSLLSTSSARPSTSYSTPASQETAPVSKAVSFGVFALRDLKANEEVMLGQE